MSASTFANKFYPFSLGLSLLSAIALSLPQSVQAASLTFDSLSWGNAPLESPIAPEETPVSNNDGIYLDRTIPASELPEAVASIVLQNASQTSGLPVSNLLIASVRQVTWTDGCMGRREPNRMCTMALVDS